MAICELMTGHMLLVLQVRHYSNVWSLFCEKTSRTFLILENSLCTSVRITKQTIYNRNLVNALTCYENLTTHLKQFCLMKHYFKAACGWWKRVLISVQLSPENLGAFPVEHGWHIFETLKIKSTQFVLA